jgi:hypothetical protein
MSNQEEYKLPWVFTEGIDSFIGGSLFCLASACLGQILFFLCLGEGNRIESFSAFFFATLITMPAAFAAFWGVPLLFIQVGLLFYKLVDEIPIFHVFFGFCITQFLAAMCMTTQWERLYRRYDSVEITLMAVIFFLLLGAYIETYYLYRKARKKLPKVQFATRKKRNENERCYYSDSSVGEVTSNGGELVSQESEKERLSKLKIPY